MPPLRVACLFLLWPVYLTLDARPWTNLDGQTMEADLIAVEDDSVTFSRDGRTNNCPRANLSEEDQRYIQEWQAERSKPSVVADEFRN